MVVRSNIASTCYNTSSYGGILLPTRGHNPISETRGFHAALCTAGVRGGSPPSAGRRTSSRSGAAARRTDHRGRRGTSHQSGTCSARAAEGHRKGRSVGSGRSDDSQSRSEQSRDARAPTAPSGGQNAKHSGKPRVPRSQSAQREVASADKPIRERRM